MAMQLITDVVQSTGYFVNPLTNSAASAFPIATYGPRLLPPPARGCRQHAELRTSSPTAIRRMAPTMSSIAPATSAHGDARGARYLGESDFRHHGRRHELPDVQALGQRRQYGGRSAHPDMTAMTIAYGVTSGQGSASNSVDTYLSATAVTAAPIGRGPIGAGHADVREPDVRTAGTDERHGDFHPQHRRDEQDRGDDMIAARETSRTRARHGAGDGAPDAGRRHHPCASRCSAASGSTRRSPANLREKQRALSAAETAEQYAEYWLANGGSGSAPLASVRPRSRHRDPDLHQLVDRARPHCPGPSASTTSLTAASVPTPMNMTTTPALGSYTTHAEFYIPYVGQTPADSARSTRSMHGGYGGSPDTTAVVESTYIVQTSVKDLGTNQ